MTRKKAIFPVEEQASRTVWISDSLADPYRLKGLDALCGTVDPDVVTATGYIDHTISDGRRPAQVVSCFAGMRFSGR